MVGVRIQVPVYEVYLSVVILGVDADKVNVRDSCNRCIRIDRSRSQAEQTCTYRAARRTNLRPKWQLRHVQVALLVGDSGVHDSNGRKLESHGRSRDPPNHVAHDVESNYAERPDREGMVYLVALVAIAAGKPRLVLLRLVQPCLQSMAVNVFSHRFVPICIGKGGIAKELRHRCHIVPLVDPDVDIEQLAQRIRT